VAVAAFADTAAVPVEVLVASDNAVQETAVPMPKYTSACRAPTANEVVVLMGLEVRDCLIRVAGNELRQEYACCNAHFTTRMLQHLSCKHSSDNSRNLPSTSSL